MCLGIPGRIMDIRGDRGLPMGTVDFGGVRRDVCLAFVPDADVGDYVIVHVGYALNRLDPEEAAETLRLFAELTEVATDEIPG